MGSAYLRLGSASGSVSGGVYANTLLYTVPAATQTVVSSIVVCNTGIVPSNFTVIISQNNLAGIVATDYIYYKVPINNNDTFVMTAGLTLAPTNIIAVAGSGIVFSAWGNQLT